MTALYLALCFSPQGAAIWPCRRHQSHTQIACSFPFVHNITFCEKKIHFHQCFKSISTVKLYLFQKGKFGGDLFYFYRQKCIFALWYIFFPFLYIVYQIQHQVQFSWFLCSLTFGPSLSFFVCLLVLLSGSVLNHRSMHVYHITASLSAQNRPNYSSVWQRPRQKPLCYLCVCVHVWAWICAVKPE